MSAIYPLTLFYDAACPVCALEMDHLRSRNEAGRLKFVDISVPGFDPAPYGATFAEMDAEIHGLRADGRLMKGVQVLCLAYEAAGLGWVLRPAGWGPLRGLSELAYRAFARHRRSISRAAAPLIEAIRLRRARRVAERMHQCTGSACSVRADQERSSL